MKRFKKILTAALCFALTALSLAACGSNVGDNATTALAGTSGLTAAASAAATSVSATQGQSIDASSMTMVLKFTFNTGDTLGFVGSNVSTLNAENGALCFTNSGDGVASIYMPAAQTFDALTVRHVQVVYKNMTSDNSFAMYFTNDIQDTFSDDCSFAETAQYTNSDPSGGDWNIITIDTSVNPNWTGTITGVRFNFGTSIGDIQVQSIGFYSD